MLRAMDAEGAYLFRHAVLRDAAYHLQLPDVRAALHRMAFELIEHSLHAADPATVAPFAEELAEHARAADPDNQHGLAARQSHYLWIAGEHAESRCEFLRAARLFDRCGELPASTPPTAALMRAARMYAYAARLAESDARLQRALELARSAGDKPAEAKALELLGLTAQRRRELPLAESRIREAIALLPSGDALSNLSSVLTMAGRHDEAERLSTQARELHRAAGNRRSEAISLCNLGNLHRDSDRLTQAEPLYTQSVAIIRDVGDRRTLGLLLNNFGWMLIKARRYPEAEKTLSESREVLASIGDSHSLANTMQNIATLHAEQGQFAAAQTLYTRAVALLEEAGDLHGQGLAWGNLACVYAESDRMAPAVEAWQRSHQLLRAARDPATEQQFAKSLNTILARTGHRLAPDGSFISTG